MKYIILSVVLAIKYLISFYFSKLSKLYKPDKICDQDPNLDCPKLKLSLGKSTIWERLMSFRFRLNKTRQLLNLISLTYQKLD